MLKRKTALSAKHGSKENGKNLSPIKISVEIDIEQSENGLIEVYPNYLEISWKKYWKKIIQKDMV